MEAGVLVSDALEPNMKRVAARLLVTDRPRLEGDRLVLDEIARKHSAKSARNFFAYVKERGTCSIRDVCFRFEGSQLLILCN
jgi:hypothetical protein